MMSGATDSSDPTGNTAFTSNTQDRISSNSVPLIEPAHRRRLAQRGSVLR